MLKKLFSEIDGLQKRIDKMRPLNQVQLNRLKDYFKIGLTYTSNAIEGNSMTLVETQIILRDGLTVSGKSLREHFEVVGHGEAYDHIQDLAKAKTITEKDIKQLHHLFYRKIDEDNAGKYRLEDVYIMGSNYPLPSYAKVRTLMKKFIEKLPDMRKTLHPVEFAARAHKDFVFIHPFVDGNGRVSRLLMNLILIQEGYAMVVIPTVLRSDYVQSLELAHLDATDFIELVARCVKETQRDYIRLLNGKAV